MRKLVPLLLVLPLAAAPVVAQTEHVQTQRVQDSEEVEALRWLLHRSFRAHRLMTDEIQLQVVRSDDDHPALLAAAAEGNPRVEVVERAHTRPECPGLAPIQRGYRVSLDAIDRPAPDQVAIELRTECVLPPEPPRRERIVGARNVQTVERREWQWVLKKVAPGAYEILDFARRW